MNLLEKNIKKLKKEIIKAAKKTINTNSYTFYIRDKHFADAFADQVEEATKQANEELKKDGYYVTYSTEMARDYTAGKFHTYEFLRYTFTVKLCTDNGKESNIKDFDNIGW